MQGKLEVKKIRGKKEARIGSYLEVPAEPGLIKKKLFLFGTDGSPLPVITGRSGWGLWLRQ